MTLVAPSAPEGGQSFTPRRAAIAAGALGLATLFGMALGSMPAFTQGTSRVSLATVGNVGPATQLDQASLEEQARQAAVQQLARAMLKKSLAEQAAAMKSAAPAQDNVAMTTTMTTTGTTTGANASAALADKVDTSVAATQTTTAQIADAQASSDQTAGAQVAAIPTPPATEQTASLDPQDMERLAGKAAEAIRSGDIASARLVLEHAVRAGDATALYALAETYDPRVLVKLRVQGMEGEPDTARNLYQRALDKGVEEARSRL
jgi:hypothetical protein